MCEICLNLQITSRKLSTSFIKACVRYFLSIFYFSPNDSPSKTIALGKCGKEGEKLQKIEYLENKKSFLDEIKRTFHSS